MENDLKNIGLDCANRSRFAKRSNVSNRCSFNVSILWLDSLMSLFGLRSNGLFITSTAWKLQPSNALDIHAEIPQFTVQSCKCLAQYPYNIWRRPSYHVMFLSDLDTLSLFILNRKHKWLAHVLLLYEMFVVYDSRKSDMQHEMKLLKLKPHPGSLSQPSYPISYPKLNTFHWGISFSTQCPAVSSPAL